MMVLCLKTGGSERNTRVDEKKSNSVLTSGAVYCRPTSIDGAANNGGSGSFEVSGPDRETDWVDWLLDISFVSFETLLFDK